MAPKKLAKTEKTQEQLWIRAPRELIDRLDRLAALLARGGPVPGVIVNRSEIARVALTRGVELLEADNGIGRA